MSLDDHFYAARFAPAAQGRASRCSRSRRRGAQLVPSSAHPARSGAEAGASACCRGGHSNRCRPLSLVPRASCLQMLRNEAVHGRELASTWRECA